MKTTTVASLKKDDQIIDFFIVRMIGLKIGSNGKQYLDLILGDSTGEMTAKKWDVSEEEAPRYQQIKTGDIIKVKALVTEWNGNKQLRVTRIRQSNKDDGLEMKDFIKAAPEEPEEMWNYLYETAQAIGDEDLRNITTRMLRDNKEKLLYYPAATRNHHAEYAGLLFHVKRMLMSGLALCNVYTELDRDWVAAGVILHDMEKLNEIQSDELGNSPGYSMEGEMLGHLVLGVRNLDRLAREIGMDAEKTTMLEHMVLAHHYEPEYGSPKRPMFPEAELLHYLDIMDARLFDMNDALAGTEPGEFSERVRTLDNRRIYRPKDPQTRTEE